jgi:septum site-determining protein MinC
MAALRGKGLGLEIVLSEDDLLRGCDDLDARLAGQPNFYRGSTATAVFDHSVPTEDQFARLRSLLEAHGVVLRGLCGGAEIEMLAREHDLEFTVKTEPQLSASARSLVADFAGARADIAARRRRGESSVPRVPAREPQLRLVPSVTTLYHTGTLRGGQALHHVGNIAAVGDVNPGAEVVATGDIVVFGRLLGVAHAGAQGDENARVYALQLAPVQLRIASYIAADDAESRHETPEVAFVRDAHITIARYDGLEIERLEA